MKYINKKYIYLLIAPVILITNICFANFIHPIDEIPFYDDGLYTMFVEIPAGTKEKWEVNHNTGELEIEYKNSHKRIIEFLSYPGNYGFIPQTVAGDNDPIDVIDLDEAKSRGSVEKVKIIGGLYFMDKGEVDVKLIGVGNESFFSKYSDINDLLMDHYAAIEIIKKWFESYKKPGKMVFYRFISKDESLNIIRKGHKKWLKNYEDRKITR